MPPCKGSWQPERLRYGGAQLQYQGVQGDGLLNIAPDQHGDFVDAGYRLANPRELHLGRQRFQFAADVPIANLARAFVQQEHVAQQFVQHLEIELELFAFAAADGLSNRYPGGRGSGRVVGRYPFWKDCSVFWFWRRPMPPPLGPGGGGGAALSPTWVPIG